MNLEPIVHLRTADPVLGDLIARVGPLEPVGPAIHGQPDAHFGALVRSIVGQQLSTHAARAIAARLHNFFAGHAPTPQDVLAADLDEMRVAAGLSRAKASYLRSLAEHVQSGELELERLDDLSDAQVIAQLTVVRGLGEWTAQMFLMFHLARPDVLPTGDLGIRKAVHRAYGLAELPAPAELERIALPWRPFRTTACRFLWRSLDLKPL